MKEKALILLSGGLDSTTCLYYAQDQNFTTFAISFDYGQSHAVELDHAKQIAQKAHVIQHGIFPVALSQIGGSALTTSEPIPKQGKDLLDKNLIPTTYVPGRNLIFLSIAAAFAEVNKIRHIFIGANAVDYSGYPDCRPDFLSSFIETANLATKAGREGQGLILHTPLLNLSKSEIIKMGLTLSVPFGLTWSCYDPQERDNGQKVPCGTCDSCILRKNGFAEAGIQDPSEKF